MSSTTTNGITISEKYSTKTCDRENIEYGAPLVKKHLDKLPNSDGGKVAGFLLAHSAKGVKGNSTNPVAVYAKNGAPYYGRLPEGWDLTVTSDYVTLSSKEHTARWGTSAGVRDFLYDFAYGDHSELKQ